MKDMLISDKVLIIFVARDLESFLNSSSLHAASIEPIIWRKFQPCPNIGSMAWYDPASVNYKDHLNISPKIDPSNASLHLEYYCTYVGQDGKENGVNIALEILQFSFNSTNYAD